VPSHDRSRRRSRRRRCARGFVDIDRRRGFVYADTPAARALLGVTLCRAANRSRFCALAWRRTIVRADVRGDVDARAASSTSIAPAASSISIARLRRYRSRRRIRIPRARAVVAVGAGAGRATDVPLPNSLRES
jgi:hypothetical protein